MPKTPNTSIATVVFYAQSPNAKHPEYKQTYFDYFVPTFALFVEINPVQNKSLLYVQHFFLFLHIKIIHYTAQPIFTNNQLKQCVKFWVFRKPVATF
ncbi:hypothetical protein [uncultured Gammaproteobacteria bacterium]|nr:hypothetical protein [uncultured Gammaproteobacteria bacterium]